jgi:hypothetical protein
VFAQGLLDHIPFQTFARILERGRLWRSQHIGQFQIVGGKRIIFGGPKIRTWRIALY